MADTANDEANMKIATEYALAALEAISPEELAALLGDEAEVEVDLPYDLPSYMTEGHSRPRDHYEDCVEMAREGGGDWTDYL